MDHVVIVGNGIAGITLARNLRKLSNHKITVISGESEYFFSRTALMYIYMGHMKYEHTKPYPDGFWKNNKIDLKFGWVNKIDPSLKKLYFADHSDALDYDILVIATGSRPAKYGWKGQDANGVQGLYSLQDLQNLESLTPTIKNAVIVGGGLIGIELAEMLYSRHIPVTFLVRESSFWNNVLPKEESALINEEIKSHKGVNLRLNTELLSIEVDDTNRVTSIITKDNEVLNCDFVGLTAGVVPNIDLAKETKIDTQRGILVDDYLQTSIKDVYAIGDCAQVRNPLPHRRPMEQVWYVGRMMGETLAHTLAQKPTAYKPGIWFNSAKFFNIEYQTYGNVTATAQENEKSFCWENVNKKIIVRINYKESSKVVVGVNTFGIRMRHEIWDRWIRGQKTIEFVIDNLEKANFDPEFFKKYEKEIRAAFYLKNAS